jgi:chloramphenicol 3-O phosphotransferase
MPSRIIYLNGPSSAGKTTIATALQERLPDPYLRVSLDALIDAMPAKVNDWTGHGPAPGYSFQATDDGSGHLVQRIVAGPYGKRIAPAFRAMAVALARSGLDLIIDDIAFGAEQVRPWRDCLRDFPTLWVGITASVATLVAREEARGDRLGGSARDQHARVHVGVDYDLLLDTTSLTIAEAVERIIAHMPPPRRPGQ